ncbi:hypothetical protein OG407_00485 [Streptomyces sp. NBC_01515]|uniref:hypothetical protein n=1 Tax=Streptomyces sp. NBC_01515 TaxID=2903890 RepID=UPI003863C4D4
MPTFAAGDDPAGSLRARRRAPLDGIRVTLSVNPKDDSHNKTITVAEDLARLSANPAHLTKACALLTTTVEAPAVVSTPPDARLARITADTDLDTPTRLLERNYQHHRVAALHPLELAWIYHQDNVPDWLRTAAASLAPADETQAVLRLLTDDELDQQPDPAAVLQSWLDAPEREGVWTDREVYRAVLNSRHHTVDHLRQLPADEVLARSEPHVALPHLLTHCATRPARWNTMLKVLDHGPTDKKITFGELLDSVQSAAHAQPLTA